MSLGRRDLERRQMNYDIGRITLIGLVIFFVLSILMHFALPRGSHAFTVFALGYAGSSGAAIGAWRRMPVWELARRLAFVQLSCALFAFGMAWLGGV